jgi:hypothetical protein
MLLYQYTNDRGRSAAHQSPMVERPRPARGGPTLTGESEVAQMAIGKKAAPAKEEKRKPDFVVRAKVKEDVWVTIGAAWSAQLKGGVTGYSLKINTFPAQWNGDALLMPPLETEE